MSSAQEPHRQGHAPVLAAESRRRLSAEQRREQLLQTAAEIVVSRGLDALTMEAVAKESGASKTLGYAYFANTDELLQALWTRELAAMFERLQRAASGATDVGALFTAAVEAYFDVVEERGLLLSVLQVGMASRRRGAGRDPESQVFDRWLAERVRAEYDVPAQVAHDLAMLAAALPGVDANMRGGRPRDRQAEARCLRFILGGLEAALRPEAASHQPAEPLRSTVPKD